VAARHLLAAIDHHSGVTLGQLDVPTDKTNEVRREAPCRIPDSARIHRSIARDWSGMRTRVPLDLA
jgi:hypothetical protein